MQSVFDLQWTALQSIDFVEGDYDTVRDAAIAVRTKMLENPLLSGTGNLRHEAMVSSSLRETVSLLMPIVRPGPAKFVVSEVARSPWCFFIANSEHGIAPLNDAKLTAKSLKTRYLSIVVCQKKGLESVQFVYSDFSKGDAAAPRIVYVHNEGGWSFASLGQPLPFEQLDAYKARRKSERLTPDMVVAYAGALGIDLTRPEDFVGRCEVIDLPVVPNRQVIDDVLA